MTIIPLPEGSFTVDASKKFLPFAPHRDHLQHRSRGSLLVHIVPFAVVTSRDIILLDTGLGQAENIEGFPLYQNLIAHGISPDDVSKVILSHLHKDHTGGLINPYTVQPAFEHADYYVQQRELEFALQTGGSSYVTEGLDLLAASGQLHLLEKDEGSIDGYIHYRVTAAHSPYHMVVQITDGHQTVFFGADDASQLAQMKRRFAAKYDFDGKKADALREQWWREGKEQGWTFLFYHDGSHPIYNPAKKYPETPE